MGYQIREQFFPPNPYEGMTAAPTIPVTFMLEMVHTHDNCAKLADHHKIPGDNPEGLRDKLSQPGIPANTTNLGGEWKFKGAGLCDVGQQKAAHLLFVRADEFVSIFSLQPPEGCGYGSDSYEEMVEKHPVAGFRRGEALYCVVGSSAKRDLTAADLRPVLEKVRASVAAGCMSHDAIVAAASASTATRAH
jgi:hypothetical protein